MDALEKEVRPPVMEGKQTSLVDWAPFIAELKHNAELARQEKIEQEAAANKSRPSLAQMAIGAIALVLTFGLWKVYKSARRRAEPDAGAEQP